MLILSGYHRQKLVEQCTPVLITNL